MNQIEAARILGRLLIDRTANGEPSRMRALLTRWRLARPEADVVVAGRYFISRTPSGALTAELHEAAPAGPTLGTVRCTVRMHGPGDQCGLILSIAAEWLGVTETAWPDDAVEIAERLARLGRLLVHGEAVVGATQVGVDQAVTITNDLDVLSSRVALVTMAIRTTVMPEGHKLRIVLASAVQRTYTIYEGMEQRLPKALEAIVEALPRSVIVDLEGDVLHLDPVCLGLTGTSDVMEALRNVSTIEKRYGRHAEGILVR
jgi:PAS domain-containing protein